jgi:myo-inositol 2-dehydrogenase/D-chiro-inositol 1-dehydrogenase
MRLGLIGLGRIGAFHATTLNRLSVVDSLVVYDPAPALVDAVVTRLGSVEPASTVEELLFSGIDGVMIAAATAAHPELILASLAAGLPTFCEKPVSKDTGASAEVLRRTVASDIPVQIGYPRRFDAAFVEARRAVAAGELGFIHTVRSTTLDPAPPSDAYIETSGGIFRDCSVHEFDAVRVVTGQEVAEVYAAGSNQGSPVFAATTMSTPQRRSLPLSQGRWRWSRIPGTTPAATMCGSKCTAHMTALPLGSSPTGRSAPQNRAAPSPRARHTSFSWTGSPMRSARS